jgi:hypothetical protein
MKIVLKMALVLLTGSAASAKPMAAAPKPTAMSGMSPVEQVRRLVLQFNRKTCVRVDGNENRCVERCLLRQFCKPRPTYAYPGPQGTDCQEWAWDQLNYCRSQCRRARHVAG